MRLTSGTRRQKGPSPPENDRSALGIWRGELTPALIGVQASIDQIARPAWVSVYGRPTHEALQRLKAPAPLVVDLNALSTTTERGLAPRLMRKYSRASRRLPEKARASYGASRSASDATSLVYTTTLVLRGRRTPPVGSVGSSAAAYTLFLARILVKVFAPVTENRYVALVC